MAQNRGVSASAAGLGAKIAYSFTRRPLANLSGGGSS